VQHAADLRTAGEEGVGLVGSQRFDSPGQFELRLKLGAASKCDADVRCEDAVLVAGPTFRDVGWNRDRSALQLGSEHIQEIADSATGEGPTN
jgi:hypothetical protein